MQPQTIQGYLTGDVLTWYNCRKRTNFSTFGILVWKRVGLEFL